MVVLEPRLVYHNLFDQCIMVVREWNRKYSKSASEGSKAIGEMSYDTANL